MAEQVSWDSERHVQGHSFGHKLHAYLVQDLQLSKGCDKLRILTLQSLTQGYSTESPHAVLKEPCQGSGSRVRVHLGWPGGLISTLSINPIVRDIDANKSTPCREPAAWQRA